MNQPKPVKYNLFKNFSHSFSGIFSGFKNEPNLTIQLLLGIASTSIFYFFDLSSTFLLINIAFAVFVISLELVNTAIEYLCDFVEPNKSDKIKFIKDVSSGAVLVTSLGWLVVLAYGFCSLF